MIYLEKTALASFEIVTDLVSRKIGENLMKKKGPEGPSEFSDYAGIILIYPSDISYDTGVSTPFSVSPKSSLRREL